jgi:NADPH-dependent ferric siderophore reductase
VRTAAIRRPPPPFRHARVARAEEPAGCARRIVVQGEELVGLDVADPAASVRALLPDADGSVPAVGWNGNEFLRGDGSRPAIRTLTPLRVDPVAGSVELEVVLHDGGPLSDWARTAAPGTEVSISGPGRGFVPDPTVRSWVLVGDESALPAVRTLLGAIGDGPRVRVLLERRRPECEVPLAGGGDVSVTWCESMVDELAGTDVGPDDHLWVAGEAAAVQRIRRHLFDDLGVERSRAQVRGYWKLGRATRA